MQRIPELTLRLKASGPGGRGFTNDLSSVMFVRRVPSWEEGKWRQFSGDSEKKNTKTHEHVEAFPGKHHEELVGEKKIAFFERPLFESRVAEVLEACRLGVEGKVANEVEECGAVAELGDAELGAKEARLRLAEVVSSYKASRVLESFEHHAAACIEGQAREHLRVVEPSSIGERAIPPGLLSCRHDHRPERIVLLEILEFVSRASLGAVARCGRRRTRSGEDVGDQLFRFLVPAADVGSKVNLGKLAGS